MGTHIEGGSNWVQTVHTPESFCWLYAIGCIDMREQEIIASGEHQISKVYIDYLRDCVTAGRKPSDDVIRRIFRRPFETLGEDCTLEQMVHYWRVAHQNPTEKTPVFKVQIVPYTKKMYPREDREGVWWETHIPDPHHVERFGRILLHNVHRYNLKPDAWVFAHTTVVGQDAMSGIIAEEVPTDDPVYRAFAT